MLIVYLIREYKSLLTENRELKTILKSVWEKIG